MNGAASTTPVREVLSHFSFSETVERLTSAIHSAGLRLFATIDHAAAAAEAGLHMPPTLVLLYGNPRAGTPLMLDIPRVALDLPLRVLVREGADGLTCVAWHRVVPMLVAAGVPRTEAATLRAAEEIPMRAVKA